MEFQLPAEHERIRAAVRELCRKYPDEYWRKCDADRAYPDAFVEELTKASWLAALIPEQYDGVGLGIAEASAILEEINRNGGNSAACHAQMYIMGTLLRHGNEEQKQRYLPKIARGELRLQAFGVTEPNAGTDTTRIETLAVRQGDRYVVNGQKVFTSRVQHSDLMLLLARTKPWAEVAKKTDGISVFLVELPEAVRKGQVIVQPIDTMINHETNALFFQDLEVPAENLIGEEGKGFRYILDGMNAERVLIAAEAIGDARWFIDRAVAYANKRVIFDRPIGQNQGIQFPLAQAYAQTEAADLMRWKAAWLIDTGKPAGTEANLAKYLAAEASWAAANACLDTHGGYGFANEYDVERKFRETRLFKVAPVSSNLVLAFIGQHVLGMPRSY